METQIVYNANKTASIEYRAGMNRLTFQSYWFKHGFSDFLMDKMIMKIAKRHDHIFFRFDKMAENEHSIELRKYAISVGAKGVGMSGFSVDRREIIFQIMKKKGDIL